LERFWKQQINCPWKNRRRLSMFYPGVPRIVDGTGLVGIFAKLARNSKRGWSGRQAPMI
jgi:hypothetical protein